MHLFFPKSISTLLLAVLIANSVLFGLALQPKSAEAVLGVGDIVSDPALFFRSMADHIWEAAKYVYEKSVDIKNAAFQYWEKFQKSDGVIAGMIRSLLMITMHQVLAKITNDTVAWINGGGKGELRVLQDPGKFLRDAVDEAGGVLAGQILGVDPASLCNADFLKHTLKMQLTGPYAVPTFNEKVQCTFSGMATGLQKFRDDFSNGGWTSFIQLLDKPNNEAGQAMLAMEEKQKIEAEAKERKAADIARNGGYLDQEECTITKLTIKPLPEASHFPPLVKLGAKMEDVMKFYPDYKKEEFKTLWKSHGGDLNCKITTPAQNIKNLADKALQGPQDSLNNLIGGLSSALGTDADSVLTPYLNAIGKATVNQIVKKGKGLITDFLAEQSKPRKVTRPPTNTLQRNAQTSQATISLVGSAGDFRSFLLSAALEFSQFITTTGKIIKGSDILGYRAINRYNFNAAGANAGKNWDTFSGSEFRTQIGPGDQGSQPGTEYRSNNPPTTCNSPLDNVSSVCYPTGTKGVTPNPAANYFTQTAGRVFFEEAEWCGAYSQVLPTTTTPPKIVATSPAPGANPIPVTNPPSGGCPSGTVNVSDRTTGASVKVCSATFTTGTSGVTAYACPTGQTSVAVAYTYDSDGNRVASSAACRPSDNVTPCPALVTVTPSTQYSYSPVTFCAPLPPIPTDLVATSNCPASPVPGATSDCSDTQWVQYRVGVTTVMATRIVGYNDNGATDTGDRPVFNRFVRQSIVGADNLPVGNPDGIPDDAVPALNALNINFTETIINTGSDENQVNGTDTILQSLAGASDAVPLKQLFEMQPNYSAGNLPWGLAQAASARTASQTFIFGGYNQFGFSNIVLNRTTGLYAGRMPKALAGAVAVFYPPNGRIYLFGGYNEKGMSDTILEYNPSNGQSRTMSGRLISPSFGFSAAYFPKNQRIYLFGGVDKGAPSDQILEYNQTTDTLAARTGKLIYPLAYSSAAKVTIGTGAQSQDFIAIAGGEYGPGVFSGSVYQYNPLVSDATALTQPANMDNNAVAHPVMTIDPLRPAQVTISGGQNGLGYSKQSWLFDASTGGIERRADLATPVSKAGGMGTTALYGGIFPWGATVNPVGAKIYPEGDIYLIPGAFPSYPALPPAPSTMPASAIASYTSDYDNSMASTSGVRAISSSETFYQKYQSPKLKGASAFLLNHRQSIDYADPTGTIINPIVLRKINDNPNQTFLSAPFYPELYEKAQDLMERIRLINGYNKDTPNSCISGGLSWPNYYQASLTDQLGTTPDDNPADNNPKNLSYFTDTYDQSSPPRLTCEAYKGSVSDVLTRYNDISKIYQALFAGIHDESSLEGVDNNLRILSPEETNIRLALIGKRCPVVPPSATSSSADLIEKCPVLSTGEYNMSRRFIFEPDDTTPSPSGPTTGFATNPFTGKKSSALAGALNLEEMVTQLQTLPPDKNIIKLIRLRQILEQLQVWRSANPNDPGYKKALNKIPVPDKANVFIDPEALVGVDTIQVSLSGYEKIQDWLNATSTPDGTPLKNQDIQDLITAYGYTTAKEAYPQISQELEDIFSTITDQVTDKMKTVFLKRMELQLEDAQTNAQHRLEKFVLYAKDMNPMVKLQGKGKEGADLKSRFPKDTVKIGYDDYVLQIDATEVFRNNGKKIDEFLGRKPDGSPIALTDEERDGIIGSAIYKIRTMAKFTGIDVNSDDFANRLASYTQQEGSTKSEVLENLDKRVKNVLRDVTMYYEGIFNQTDPSVEAKERDLIPKSGSYGCTYDSAVGYYCELTTKNLKGEHPRIYKDARTQMAALNDNFDNMVAEISAIKDEFQTVMTDVQMGKEDADDMVKLFSVMQNDYAQANACFGLQNPPDSLWKPSIDQIIMFGGGDYGGVGGVVLDLLYIGGGAIAGAIAKVFGWGRKKDDGAAARARAIWQAKVDSCKDGFVKFNRHMGQVADQFLCGKINPKYED